MDAVLIVEDMKLFGNMLVKELRAKTPFGVVWVQSLAEAERVIDSGEHDFFLALLDLTLPDAMDGEIVDMVLSRNLTSIVFTATLEDAIREEMWAKNIADYVFKDQIHSLDYIVNMVTRLHGNPAFTILVADDSKAQRQHMSRLLRIHRYQVLEAASGQEALDILRQHPEVQLVIADYYMPNMNGHELTMKIREKYGRGELAVIGVSAIENHMLSVQFIKSGANDFLNKPFVTEEFYCRVGLNVEMQQNVACIRDASNKDFLTGLWNRRYFLEHGQALFESCRASGKVLFAAMMDIDHFKNINDTYGHDAGDQTLLQFSLTLAEKLGQEALVARLGGEEFGVLMTDDPKRNLLDRFEFFREHVAAMSYQTDKGPVSLTVSIGICPFPRQSLHLMLKDADRALYDAKEQGRNRVVISS